MERLLRTNGDAAFNLRRPYAVATLLGTAPNEGVEGTVHLFEALGGTRLLVQVRGLPKTIYNKGKKEPAGPFYAFHIHEGNNCDSPPAAAEPFPLSKGHFNPTGKPHPLHAGDLPPLLSDNGYAWMSVYTPRFTPQQVVGRTVIIHQNPDDFRTQPSGNAGLKIACGVIEKL